MQDQIEIDRYLINYTQSVRSGEIGHLVGRDRELERLIHILLRSTKNNPVVVGSDGIGKTALLEGLIAFMASDQAPDYLQAKEVVGINIPQIMLDTESEAEYAELVKRVMELIVDSDKQKILYLKDISLLVNVDTNPENKEPAKFLKLCLSNGQVNCLIETGTQSFVGYMEKDNTVMSHVQTVILEEPTVSESIEIVKALKQKFEEHYGVIIPEETVIAACQLANRYIKQRAFPAKALDLLDDSASLLMMDIAKGEVDPEFNVVTVDFCNRTIAAWTGIPVEKVDAEDKQRLANAEYYLKQRVVGQDNAVTVVANALRRARSGLQDPNRPIGSFLFIGTTGVGKTELAKSLADFMFDDETALLRLDMSEYMERTSVARMIGPAPGTPGFEAGGLLTESVRLKPFQVILFDEIEKAHLDILNLMLQLLDEGRLTDSKGVTVDFRNTIIILTSNVGANLPSYQRVEKLGEYFRPEFLNRLDDIVSFHQLNEEHLRIIVDIHLNKLLKRAAAIGYNVVVAESAKDWFVDEVFTSKFGVRALKRLIQNQVENPLSFLIMQEKIRPGQDVFLNVDKTGRKLQIYSKTRREPSVSQEIIENVEDSISTPQMAVLEEKSVNEVDSLKEDSHAYSSDAQPEELLDNSDILKETIPLVNLQENDFPSKEKRNEEALDSENRKNFEEEAKKEKNSFDTIEGEEASVEEIDTSGEEYEKMNQATVCSQGKEDDSSDESDSTDEKNIEAKKETFENASFLNSSDLRDSEEKKLDNEK